MAVPREGHRDAGGSTARNDPHARTVGLAARRTADITTTVVFPAMIEDRGRQAADVEGGDPTGSRALGSALAEYLGRVRGVVADPEHVAITNGYTQSLGWCAVPSRVAGAARIAVEDPSNLQDRLVVARAGRDPLAVGVDGAGDRRPGPRAR